MALNIRDLVRMCEFSLELQSLGTVRCISLNADHFSQANKKLASSGVQSLDFVRWVLGEIVRRPVGGRVDEDDAIEGASLTTEELSSVTDEDLEEFADKLTQKNRYLLKTHKGSDIERLVDEPACDFLVRAFRHYAAEQKTQWERMIEPVSKSLFTSATVAAMQRNLGLSSQFQDTIDKYTRGHSAVEQMLSEEKNKWERMTQSVSKSLSASAAVEAIQCNHGALDQFRDGIEKHAIDLPKAATSFAEPRVDVLNSRMLELHIQKNPIHDTNEMLESVVRQIDDLRPMAAQAAQIIRSMNDTALGMQADYIENAKTAGRQTRNAIWIAAVSLLVSAIGLAISSFFSYQSYVDVKESGVKSEAQIKAFQNEIRDLATAQYEERAFLVKAIVDARRVSAAPVKK